MGLLKSVVADARSTRSASALAEISIRPKSGSVGNSQPGMPVSEADGGYSRTNPHAGVLRDQSRVSSAKKGVEQTGHGQAINAAALDFEGKSRPSMSAAMQNRTDKNPVPAGARTRVKAAAKPPRSFDGSLASGTEPVSESGKTTLVTRITGTENISPNPDRLTTGSAGIPASVGGQPVDESQNLDLNAEPRLDRQPETTGKEKVQSPVDKSAALSKSKPLAGDVEAGKGPGIKTTQVGVDTESAFNARALPKQSAPQDNAMNASAGPVQAEDSRIDEDAVAATNQPSPVTLAADSPPAKNPQSDDLSLTGPGSQVETKTLSMPHQDMWPHTDTPIRTDASDHAMREPVALTEESPVAAAADATRSAASAVARAELDAKLNTVVQQARAASVQPQDDKSADLQAFVEHSSSSRVTPIEVPRTPEVRIGQVDVIVEGASRPQVRSTASQRPSPGLVSRHYLRRL